MQATYGNAADAAMRQAQAGGAKEDAATRLKKIGELREQGLLTDDEYEAKKAELIKEL